MDAQTRLEIIKERFKRPASSVSKPVGLFSASHPEIPRQKPKRLGVFRNPNARHLSYVNQFESDVVADIPAWAKRGDKREVHCSVKRTKKVSPLTAIAGKWDDPDTFRPHPTSS